MQKTNPNIFSLFIVFLFPIFLCAQNQDSIKVERWLNKAFNFQYNNIDSANFYCNKAYEAAKELNIDVLVAYARYRMGSIYRQKRQPARADSILNLSIEQLKSLDDGHVLSMCYSEKGLNYLNWTKLDSAEYWFSEALTLKINGGDKDGEAIAYNNLGLVADYKGKFPEALNYYQKALPIFEELGNREMESNSYNNISILQYNIGEFEKAIESQKKAVEINEQEKSHYNLAMNHVCLTNYYYELDSFSQSEIHGLRALYLCDSLNFDIGRLYSLAGLGAMYKASGDLDESLIYYRKFNSAFPEDGDPYMSAQVSLSLGQIFLEKEGIDSSEFYLSKAEVVFQELGTTFESMTIYDELSKVFAKQRRFEKAYESLAKSKVFRDSFFNEEKTKEILELEKIYQYEKQQKELIEKDLEVVKRRQQNILLSFLGILALIGMALFWRKSRREKRKAQAAALRNQELQERNAQLIEELKSIPKDAAPTLDLMANKSFTLSNNKIFPLKDIIKLEKESDMVYVFAEGEEKKIIQWGSLKSFVSNVFQPPLFVRINQSAVVNVYKVQSYSRSKISIQGLHGIEELSFGRAFKKEALSTLDEFFPKLNSAT